MFKAPFFDQKVETNIQINKKDDDEEKFLRESFDLAHDIVVNWTNKNPNSPLKIDKKSFKKKNLD